MTRTTAREIAVHIAFEAGLNFMSMREILNVLFDEEYFASLGKEEPLYKEYPDEKQKGYIEHMALGVSEHLPELDSYIEKYAKGWKVGRISRIAVAIMRVAMYEVLYMPEIPDAAAINEAVELCKKYEEPEMVPFVNGILGSFVRGEKSNA